MKEPPGVPYEIDLREDPYDPKNIPRGPIETLRAAILPNRGGLSRRTLLITAVGGLAAFGAGAGVQEAISPDGRDRLVNRVEDPPTEITRTELQAIDDGFKMLPVNDSLAVDPLKKFPQFFTKAQRKSSLIVREGMSESELLKPLEEPPLSEQKPVPVLVGAKPQGEGEVTTLTEIILPETLSECGTLIEMGDNVTVFVATRGSQPFSVKLVPVKEVENRKGSQLCMLQVASESGNFPSMSSVYIAINSQPPVEEPVVV